MNIVVLNGSPKGDMSVTMQSIEYLKLEFPGENIEIINIAEKLNAIEKDPAFFNDILVKIDRSDGVLWAFPLYHLLVHSNYKRFIELLFERGAKKTLEGKYCASFSTSIHFSDNTAHNYIEGIACDLGMRFADSFSAEMNDLTIPGERKRLTAFFRNFLHTIGTKAPTAQRFAPLRPNKTIYTSSLPAGGIATGKKITVVTDVYNPESNIGRMIDAFRGRFAVKPALAVLSDCNIKGGCLGCCHCGPDSICAYDKGDDFREFYEENILRSDIVIIAGEMKDRYFSHQIKRMFDRSFYKTHIPVLAGKQMGYLVSGPLSQEFNFRTMMEFYPDMEEANLFGIVSDESGNSGEIDAQIAGMSENAVRFAESGYIRPSTFLGVGGRKVFRDSIYGRMRLVFHADYRYYKKHRMFDFPQKQLGTRLTNFFLYPILRIKQAKEAFQKMMKTGMILSHQKVLKKFRRTQTAELSQVQAGVEKA